MESEISIRYIVKTELLYNEWFLCCKCVGWVACVLVAILEMNMSEPLFAELKESSCIIRSLVQETVLENDEEADKKEEEDEEKDDEGISTEPEPSEPATDNPLTSTETVVEETVERETIQRDTELLPNVEPELNGEESPTMEFLLSQPELDPEILALQTQLDSRLMDSNHFSSVSYRGNDAERPSVEVSAEEEVNVPLTTTVVSPLPMNSLPHDPIPRKKWRRVCYRVAVAVFVGIIVVLLIAVFLLELKADFPVVGHISLTPAIQEFRVRHYIPFREAVEEMIHSWFAY